MASTADFAVVVEDTKEAADVFDFLTPFVGLFVTTTAATAARRKRKNEQS